MGDRMVRPPPRQNGVLVSQNAPQLPSQGSNPFPLDIPTESWQVAEDATQLIIWRIQPTKVSERRRRGVVDYVQRLVRETLGSEVFPFGSVPLKTYLPDGDIDLTAVCLPSTEENLACEVRGILEFEEQNNDAGFEVKDVQYINAEVKLVKCLVQNIVVDISFNQIGGLCTLCFLEKVDRKIGKNNLFKRSIILIKAWCYYESRILGAHHALISTYALETLVLYIFHFFHSSLNSPLEVLYIFLDYFGKFDWDNFCVSLRGPVHVSSLPDIVVARSEQNGSDHLLSKEFLDECVEKYSVPPKISDNNNRSFVKKHLNVVDPLKENNNLGRSVSKGNFHRIRSAFTYGARKLGKILSSSKEEIASQLNKFFMNTLERHGNGERPDVRDISTCNDGVPNLEKLSHYITNDKTGTDTVESCQPMESEMQVPKFMENGCITSRRKYVDDISVSGECLSQEVSSKTSDPPAAGFSDLKIANGGQESSCQVTNRTRCVFHPTKGIGQSKLDESHQKRPTICEAPVNETVSELYRRVDRTDFTKVQTPYSSRNIVAATSMGGTTKPSSQHMDTNGISDASITETASASSNVSPDVGSLSELSGDQMAQSEDLSNAKMLYRNLLSGAIPRNLLSPRYHGRYQWDIFPLPNVYPHVNGVISGPFPYDPNYYINLPFVANSNGKEDLPRPRGTGIFFPNTHNYQQPFKDKSSHGRGRNPLSTPAPKHRNNGRAGTPPEHTDKGEYAPELTVLSPVSRDNSRTMPGKLESPHASPGIMKASSDIKPYHVEIGTFGPIPLDVSLVELGKNTDANNLNDHSSTASTCLSDVQIHQLSMNEGRSEQLYHLKDEGDFPPLLGQGQPTTSIRPKLQKTAWGSRSRSSIS